EGSPDRRGRAPDARQGPGQAVHVRREHSCPGRLDRPFLRVHPSGAHGIWRATAPAGRGAAPQEGVTNSPASSQGVRLERDGPVATVTLCRPDVLNAQTPAIWRAIRDFSRDLPGDIRVVVVRGEGRS